MDTSTRIAFESSRVTALKCYDEMLAVKDKLGNLGADNRALQERFAELQQDLYHAHVNLLDIQKKNPSEHVIGNAVAVVDGYFADLGIDPPGLP